MSGSLSQLYLANPALANAMRRQQFGQGLAQEGMSTAPTSGWGALARLAQAYVGGKMMDSGEQDIQKAGDDMREEARQFMMPTAGSQPAQLPAPVTTPPGQQMANVEGLDMSLPLTDRLNNPGALKFAGQPGAINVNGFAMFPTREAGLAAADSNLAGYAGKGINTLGAAITRWAPPSENDTAAYINRVSQASGLDPNAPIDLTDKAVRDRILPHMFSVEGGNKSIAGGAPPRPMPAGGAPGAAPPPPALGGMPGGAPANLGGAPRASSLADQYMLRAQELFARAQEASTSRNPMIRDQVPVLKAQADMFAKLGSEKPQQHSLSAGGMLVDASGRVIASNPDRTQQPVVIQDGVDEKGQPRWVYASRDAAVGKTAPTPGPMVNVDQRGLNAETQEHGTNLAKAGAQAKAEASAAAEILDRVRYLRDLKVDTDRFSGVKEVFGSILDGLGVQAPEAIKKATDLQTFNGALSALVLGEQLKQKGVQTEGDAMRMREQFAKATNTMEANDLLLRSVEAAAQRKIDKSAFLQNWRNRDPQHPTYEGGEDAWNKFIREVPMTIRSEDGRIAFFNEYVKHAREMGADEAQIINDWKQKAARK